MIRENDQKNIFLYEVVNAISIEYDSFTFYHIEVTKLKSKSLEKQVE